MAKFFVTANVSIISCQNKYLRALCDETLGKYALVNDILPKLKTQIKTKQEKKLNSAVFINLVTDIWSNISSIPMLGLAVSVVYSDFSKESFAIGLEEMKLPQNAENCKLAIETIINSLEFNKAKIQAVIQFRNKFKFNFYLRLSYF